MNPLLKLSKVSFNYGKNQVLTDVSLSIDAGQVCCVLGPSGCGKTSLIRMIAGFEQPQTGQIDLNGQLVAGHHTVIPAEQRNIGMVFQDLTLFPHLTIEQNIGFGLDHLSSQQSKQRIDELIVLCRLDTLRQRYPHQISGGQQQRVALARALAPKPQLLLLDEPFSSVDASLKRQLAQEVKRVLLADKATAVWVTHDLQEAFMVSDRIGLLIDGRLQQWSSPEHLYEHPANLSVARFLNHGEIIKATVVDQGLVETAIGILNVEISDLLVAGDVGHVLVNRKDFFVESKAQTNATLLQKTYGGGHYLLRVRLNSGEIIDFNSQQTTQKTGDKLAVAVKNNSPLFFA